jgi:hypothetical protein
MKRLPGLILATVASCLMAAPSFAQFPAKPIRVVVPFPSGSATDTVARILGQSVSAAIGHPVLVDNKVGADGAIAGAEVAKAAPDGYTLLMATNSPMAVAPAMKKVPPYDPVTDFTPITDVGRYTFFLYVNAGLPIRSFQELVAYAKANPGKLNYATGNTTGIVSFAQMNSLTGIDMTHVPYKGEPQGITDLRPRLRQGGQAARDRDQPEVPLRAAARGADDGGSRGAAIFGGVLGGAVWPGEDAPGHPDAPQQGIPRRDEASGRDGVAGQAGVPHQPDHAGGTGRLHQVAIGGLPRDPARRRRAAGVAPWPGLSRY